MTPNKVLQTDKVKVVAMFATKVLAGGAFTGCCAFTPCHPATYVTGRITTLNGDPLYGASVRLYGRASSTDSDGCFRLGGADALPNEFSVEANGYKPIRHKVRPGSFQLQVRLASENNQAESTVQWQPSRTYPPPNVAGCT